MALPLWVGLVVAIALAFVFPPGTVVVSAVVAVVAHLRGLSLLRTLAIAVLVIGLVALLFGSFGSSFEGGLID